MKETKIAKEIGAMEFIHLVLPIFVVALVGVFITKEFYQITLMEGLTITCAGLIGFGLVNIGGFSIYKIWRDLK